MTGVVVALNGTSLNGTSVNGTSLHGSSVAPPMLPPFEVRARFVEPSPMSKERPGSPAAAGLWPQSAADLDDELARLEAEVVAANARAESAKDLARARDAEVRAVLRAELIACREVVAQMDREHDMTIEMLRTAAQAEVRRILAAARQMSTGTSTRAGDAQWPGVIDAK